MRSRTKLRLLDWLILLAVLLGVALFAMFFRSQASAGEAELTAEYVLLLPPDEKNPQIMPGTVVKNENGTVTLGKVTEVRILPYREPFLRDRKIVYGEVGDLKAAEVSVMTVVSRRAGQGLRAGEIRIAAGSIGNFRLGNRFISGAKVLSVQVSDEAAGGETA